MNEDFWVNIKSWNIFYVVEICHVAEDRIVYIEKKKALTRFGAKRVARKKVLEFMSSKYIHDKIV